MSRAVITGIGAIGSTGVDVAALRAAVRDGRPLGRLESVETVRGRRRELRLARIAPLDREAFLPALKLRRMCEVSQIWTIACMLARSDAGLDRDPSPYPPERRGTFVGTGLGCLGPTWDFLCGLSLEGAANPFYFSESVANAPAGHSTIELETRGASVTLTCGDASATAAMAVAVRAIADGRVALAYCGGVELLTPQLLRVIAALRGPRFFGEGCASFVVESADAARARGARIYAEVIGTASASDPACGPTSWSADSARLASVMQRAAERSDGVGIGTVVLHAGGARAAEDAESRAAASVFPHATICRPSRVVGSMTAAGALGLAVSALEACHTTSRDAVLVLASSWGGGMHAIVLRGDCGLGSAVQ